MNSEKPTKDKTDTFCIVTPTYNRSALLIQTIESVLAQTYPHWEMIIVDDGSTDDTYDKVLPYLDDARIHYHRQPVNKGHLAARNRAWDELQPNCDWVVHLDSDDVFLKDALEQIMKGIREHPGHEWYQFGVKWDNGKIASQGSSDGFIGSYKGRLTGKDASGEWVQVLHRNIIVEGYRFLDTLRENPSTALWYRLSRDKAACYCTRIVRIQNSNTESVTRPKNRSKRYYSDRAYRMHLFFQEFGEDLLRFDHKVYKKRWKKYIRMLIGADRRSEALRISIRHLCDTPLGSVYWKGLLIALFKKRQKKGP